MKRSSLVLIALCCLMYSAQANAACPPVTVHTLTNGTIADAALVMDNFNYLLGCPRIEELGLGKTPTYTLDVDAKTFSLGTIAQFDSSYLGGGGIRIASQGVTELWLGTGDFATSTLGLGLQDVGMVARGSLVLDTDGAHSRPAMYIARSGNIALGGTAPLALLDLLGDSSSSSTAIAIRFTDVGSNANRRSWLLGNASGPNYGDLAFLVSPSAGTPPSGIPILNLSRTGNVGINTANPAQALEVNGQIKVNSLASASGTPLCINASVIASCSSSLRYKENIRSSTFGLLEVERMRPVTFNWKGRAEADFGLIAEEVAKIDSRFITRVNGRIEGVKYPQLTAVLIGAVKELAMQNAQQRQEIKALKDGFASEIRALRSKQLSQLQKINVKLEALEKNRRLQTARLQE